MPRAQEHQKKICTLLDLCVSSLRRGHANLLCIVPILTDDPRRESKCTITQTAISCISARAKPKVRGHSVTKCPAPILVRRVALQSIRARSAPPALPPAPRIDLQGRARGQPTGARQDQKIQDQLKDNTSKQGCRSSKALGMGYFSSLNFLGRPLGLGITLPIPQSFLPFAGQLLAGSSRRAGRRAGALQLASLSTRRGSTKAADSQSRWEAHAWMTHRTRRTHTQDSA